MKRYCKKFNPFFDWQIIKEQYFEIVPKSIPKIVAKIVLKLSFTGKSLSEVLIFASTNPQYDGRLFIELQVQYKKYTKSEHVVYKNCFLF